MIIDMSAVEALVASVQLPNGTHKSKIAEASFYKKDDSLRLHLRVVVKVNGEDGMAELPPVSLVSKGVTNQRGLSQLAAIFTVTGVDATRWKRALDFDNKQLVDKIQAELQGRTLYFRFRNEILRDDGTKVWADYVPLTLKQYNADLVAANVRVEVEKGGDAIQAAAPAQAQAAAPVQAAPTSQPAPTPPAASDDVW